MASLGELFVTVGAKIEGFQQAMSTVSQQLSAAQRDADKAAAGFTRMGGSLTSLGGTLTAGITAPLAGLGVAVAVVAGKLEQTQAAFTTMLGSAAKAQDLLKQLQQFAATTPFEFPDLVNAAKRMLAMGFSAEQLLPMLRTIGDAVSAIGGGAPEIDRVTLALGQMQAKGKVSAQEMNQLAEIGIPAWKLLADAIGISIPEAMKLAEQGAIQASVAIPAILEGMNQKFSGAMVSQSQTLLGQWSNFKDQITLTLMDLGVVLLPILKDLLTAATPLLNVIKNMATYFGTLPQPVQTTILAMVALAAAIGPILMVVGSLVSSFGTIVAATGGLTGALSLASTAFGALTGPVGLVLAALVALGAWVVANWEPIVAVLKQAWAGLTELWAYEWGVITNSIKTTWEGIKAVAEAVWPYISGFIKTIWGPVITTFGLAWTTIKDLLVSYWGVIKTVATAVWGYISDVITGFLEVARKVPGVAKLLDLGDTWKNAKKTADELKNAGTQAGGLEKQAKSTATEAKKFDAQLLKLGDSAKDAAKEEKALEKQTEAFAAATQKARTENLKSDTVWQSIILTVAKVTQRKDELVQSISRLKANLAEQPAYIGNVNASLNAMAISLESARIKADALRGGIPELNAAMQSALNQSAMAADYLGDAFKHLGITSATEYAKIAVDAKKAYEAISGSGVATQYEKDNAMLRMLKAQADAMKANGVSIPKDMEKLMADLEAKVGDKAPAVRGAFDSLAHSVSQVIGDLSKDLLDSLFEGDMSWAEKGKNALKTLGKAVLNEFVTPATDAIGKFIATTIADLLSGKGLGGVLDSIKSIGSAWKGIFGGGDPSTPSAPTPGTPSVPSTGAGGSAGAFNIIDLITGIGTLISNIISNFQLYAVNKTLDLIEHEVRYTQLHTLNILEKLNEYIPSLRGIEQALLGPVLSALRDTRDAVADFVNVTVNVSSDDEQGGAILKALIGRLERADFGVGDKIEDLKLIATRIHDAINQGFANTIKAITSGTDTLSGLLGKQGGLLGLLSGGLFGAGGVAGVASSGVSALGSIASSGIANIIASLLNRKGGKTEDLIEENTRYAQIHLLYILDKINAHLPGLDDINKRLNEWGQQGWPSSFLEKLDALWLMAEQIRNGINAAYQSLENIHQRVYEIATNRIDDIVYAINSLVPASGASGATVVLTVDGREIARSVVNYLDDAGARP